MSTILITGGTGMIGTVLGQSLLDKGYQLIILTRSLPAKNQPIQKGLSYARWDVDQGIIDEEAIGKADYIIHLAGAGVADKRWSEKRKKQIVDSRVKSGKLIFQTLSRVRNKVRAVISASAIGWYGADPSIPNPQPFVESDPPDTSFLGHTCKLWEESLQPLCKTDVRLVFLRTGIVLSKKGGALSEFKKPLKFGVAAILGNGKQIISWIHIDDLVQLYIAALENDQWLGAYNAVAPKPSSNAVLTRSLAKIKNGKKFIAIHVPSILLRLAIGEMSIEVLKSATVSSSKVENAGYVFRFPDLDPALNDLK